MITTIGETNADLARSKKLLQTEEDKLREACQGFESLLMHQMLKGMRAVNKSMGSDLIKKNNMEEFFTDMLDQEMADNVSKTSQNGIADVLFNSLKHTLNGKEPVAVDQLTGKLKQNTNTDAMLNALQQRPMIMGDYVIPDMIEGKAEQAKKRNADSELDRNSMNGYITRELEKGASISPERLPSVKTRDEAYLIDLREANRNEIR